MFNNLMKTLTKWLILFQIKIKKVNYYQMMNNLISLIYLIFFIISETTPTIKALPIVKYLALLGIPLVQLSSNPFRRSIQ